MPPSAVWRMAACVPVTGSVWVNSGANSWIELSRMQRGRALSGCSPGSSGVQAPALSEPSHVREGLLFDRLLRPKS